MPKSKRNKLVTLSKTSRKGREHKEGIVSSVRAAAEEYSSVYVFEYDTMRNNKLKELREELKDTSRFFLGGNKVLQLALGRDEATELRDGLRKCSELIEGQRGLLFTNLAKDDVVRRLEEFAEPDYARTGSLATETVELPEGPLTQFTHDMEPFLRRQGLPVRLNRGTIELLSDFTVCREGEPLTAEAATILRLLGIQQAVFRLHLIARWSTSPSSDGHEFEVLRESEEGGKSRAQGKKKPFREGFVDSDDEEDEGESDDGGQ